MGYIGNKGGPQHRQEPQRMIASGEMRIELCPACNQKHVVGQLCPVQKEPVTMPAPYPITNLNAGDVVEFDYLNHEAKREPRTVTFKLLQYGSNEWYSNEFLLHGYCHDRKALRSFAISHIVDGSFRVAG